MIEFCFEHEFRARSVAAVFEAYFDPEQAAEQDALVGIARREVVALEDADGELRRTCHVVPRRQLPAVLRPLVAGELSYRERLRWRRARDELELVIEPSLLGGRVELRSTYQLRNAGPGRVARRYAGHVAVELRLLGGRVERAILDDLARSLPAAAACTQRWLDRRGLAACAPG